MTCGVLIVPMAAVVAMLVVLQAQPITAMHMPKDVEILEGYEFDESPEYYGTDSNYYEARSMLTGMGHRAIRNKRSTLEYDIAKGLVKSAADGDSQKKSETDSDKDQTDEPEKTEMLQRESSEHGVGGAGAQMPKAERQIMDPDYDYYSQRHIASWSGPRAQSVAGVEDDTVAEASYNGYLPRARQPRVNFIPPGKKEPDAGRSGGQELPVIDTAKLPKLKPSYDGGKYAPAPPAYDYDVYPSRSYDPYLRRYDRYDEQYPRYDPYYNGDQYVYRRHYDPYDSYSPRLPQYPEPFYNYPDRRYDVPEPREYLPLYNNDIYDKSPPPPYPSASHPSTMLGVPPGGYGSASAPPSAKYPDYSRSQRRFVYYAHLPEIVRTPYDNPYSNRYDDYYDRERYDGLLTASKATAPGAAYKYEKPGSVSNASGAGANVNADPYEYMKRDKKDRVTPKPKTNSNTRN